MVKLAICHRIFQSQVTNIRFLTIEKCQGLEGKMLFDQQDYNRELRVLPSPRKGYGQWSVAMENALTWPGKGLGQAFFAEKYALTSPRKGSGQACPTERGLPLTLSRL